MSLQIDWSLGLGAEKYGQKNRTFIASIESDDLGYLYVAGESRDRSFDDEVNPSYCPGLYNQINCPNRTNFITKRKPDGSKEWTTFINASNPIHVWDHSVNKSDGSIIVLAEDRISGQGYIAKYSNDGDLLWEKQIRESGPIGYFSEVAISRNGDIYMTSESHLMRLSAFGDLIWREEIVTHDLAVTEDGLIYTVGQAKARRRNPKLNQLHNNPVVQKYSADGELLWQKLIEGPRESSAYGVALDKNNQIYVAGHTFGNLDGQLNLAKKDGFIAKLNPKGEITWTKIANTEQEKGSQFNDLYITEDNFIYLAGTTSSSVFDGVKSNDRDTIRGLFAKYKTDGELQWIKGINGRMRTLVPSKITGSGNESILFIHADDDIGDVFRITKISENKNALMNQINITSSTFSENIPINEDIAQFVVNGSVSSVGFASGEGDDDNHAFDLSSGSLRVKDPSYFKPGEVYKIRVVGTDDDHGYQWSSVKAFELEVLNEEHAPNNILLSSTAFEENLSKNTVVSWLGAEDDDENDSHYFAFARGEGDADNGAFSISGNALSIKLPADFETKSIYRIRLLARDSSGLTFEKAFALSVNDVPEDNDVDKNGIVDNSRWIQISRGESSSIYLFNSSNGKRLKEASGWNALKAIATDEGYQVLLEGIERKSDGKYKVLSVGGAGGYNPRTGMSPWMTGEEMMWSGYEEAFQIDFNDDSVFGISFEDSDGNGLVDKSSSLKLINSDQAFDIVKGAKRRPQKNGSGWRAIKAISIESGYQVLIEGINAKLMGKFKIWSVDLDGLIQGQSAWKTAEQMMWDGYEGDFALDINQDSITGISFDDADDNGLVDNSTSLRLANGDEAVSIVKGVKRRPQKNGSRWSALKAVGTDSGYEVLLQGNKGKLAGKFKVWSLNSEGAILNQTRWRTEKWITQNGYDEVFSVDILDGAGVAT